jgi:hypothetical protein
MIFLKNYKKICNQKPGPPLFVLSRVILLIGLGLGNKKAPGRGAFLLLSLSTPGITIQ